MIGRVWRRLLRAGEAFTDRFVASDPGMTRLFFAVRPMSSVLIVVILLLVIAGWPVPVVLVGGLLALNVATSLRDPQLSRMLVAAGGALAFAFVSLTVAASLVGHRIPADIVFLVVIFLAVYLRRFEGWGLPAGFAGFMSFFVAQFTRIDLPRLPQALGSAAVGITAGFVVVLLMTRFVRRHAAERMLSALRVRVARIVDGVDEALRSGGLDGRRADALGRAADRLHESALMIESELEQGSDLAVDERVRRSVVRIELAGERLVVAGRWGLAEGISESCRARTVDELDQLRVYLRRNPGPALRADQKRLLEGVRALEPAAATGERERAEARLRKAVRELVLAVVLVRREFEPDRLAESRRRPWERRDRGDEEVPQVTPVETTPAEGGRKRLADRMELTTRQAVQAVVAGAVAIAGGELLSAQRWYWAVITAFVVFVGTSSRGDLLVKGFRRALGTVVGVVIGIVVAVPVAGNVPLAAVIVLISVFLAFYFVRVAYSLTSFFITVMLSLLYDLLGTFSPGVLVLRVEETAIGVVAGCLAAVLVLPTKTGESVVTEVATFLGALRSFLERSTEMLVDGETVNLIEESRQVDRALETVKATTTPLLHRISPFRGRRNALGYLMTLLDLCAFRARTLAASSETAALADHPGFAESVRRVELNLDRLVAALGDDGKPRKRLASGTGLADDKDAVPASAAGRRLLVYFDRLDTAIMALARPVDALSGRPWSDRGSDSLSRTSGAADPPTIPVAVGAVRE